MPATLTKADRLPVLSLDRDGAEWLPDPATGHSRLGQAPVEGSGVRALVTAAEAAVAAAGARPSRCILALGPGLVRQRLFHLPVLSRRETRAALARKSAILLECEPEEAAYTATAFDDVRVPSDAKAKGTEQRWLVVALRRDETRALEVALAAAGFRVVRTVSSQLSLLARGQVLRTDAGQACIVVAAQRKSASVALVAGDALVNENVLEGDIRTQPSLAMSLVQEIKSFDASWRKANRGGAVGQVVLLGLPRERAQLFQAAVSAALPSTRVLLPELSDAASDTDLGRAEALAACREAGGLQADLRLPVPMGPRAVASVLVAICAALATVATVAYRPAREAELAEIEAVAALNASTADLEDLRARNEATLASIRALEGHASRNASVLGHGWPLHEVVVAALTALEGGAALTGIELGPFEKRLVRISGVAASDPVLAMVGVDRAVERLAAKGRFVSVAASPAGTLPSGTQPIPFAIEATLEERP